MSELKFEPFNSSKHKPISTVGGSSATEYTATEQDPSGKFFNFPQIWFEVSTKKARLFSGERGMEKALEYESLTGKKFPRYNTVEEAVAAAEKRSRQGGASKKTLLKGN